jgi:hypothetical protein
LTLQALCSHREGLFVHSSPIGENPRDEAEPGSGSETQREEKDQCAEEVREIHSESRLPSEVAPTVLGSGAGLEHLQDASAWSDLIDFHHFSHVSRKKRNACFSKEETEAQEFQSLAPVHTATNQ